MSPLGVGLIGAGVISDTYLSNLQSFPDIDVVIVGDLDGDRARARADAHRVRNWGSADDVLDHPDVELVVNLTVPSAHTAVSSAAIAAGKHVWTEKPLGLERTAMADLLARARAAGLRVGSAPDTLLGPGFQTARRAIAGGTVGDPLFALATFQTQGPDLWHPNPGFLFAAGAGPLLDIGPYYFSALVTLLGPVREVTALGMKAREIREIRTGPAAGTAFPVEVPSTIQVLARFESGQQAQTLMSFDSALERQGVLEIHGTDGSMVLPDPNQFSGRIAYVKPLGVLTDDMDVEQPWHEIPPHGPLIGRGIGVLDMARAIAEDRPHIATGELAQHVVDILLSAQESASLGEPVRLTTTTGPVPLLADDFDPFAATL